MSKKRGKKSKNKTQSWNAVTNKWTETINIESIENKVLIEFESEENDDDIIVIINEDEEEVEIEDAIVPFHKSTKELDIEEYYAQRYGS